MPMFGYADSTTCAVNAGGNITLYLAEASEVTDFTAGSNRELTAVNMVASAVFKEYHFKEDTAELKVEGSGENGSVKFVNMFEMYLERMDNDAAQSIQDIADKTYCGMIGIARDSNGNQWVLGYDTTFGKRRPLRFKSSAGSTGKKLDDQNGEVVTLGNESSQRPFLFTGTVPV